MSDDQAVSPQPFGGKRTYRNSIVEPRGLRKPAAAAYVGVSPSQFDKWVAAGIVPASKKIGGVVLWDRRALDDAIEALFYAEADPNSLWDQAFN